MIYAFLIFLLKKHFLAKNYFLTDDINLTTRGPLYTCLVNISFCSSLDFEAVMFLELPNKANPHFGGTQVFSHLNTLTTYLVPYLYLTKLSISFRF